jgi:hypothetical protein
MPVHTGQVFSLGCAPKAAEQAQKILLRVESWAWTSSPMTASNSIALMPFPEGRPAGAGGRVRSPRRP